jgi:hypothetical protein
MAEHRRGRQLPHARQQVDARGTGPAVSFKQIRDPDLMGERFPPCLRNGRGGRSFCSQPLFCALSGSNPGISFPARLQDIKQYHSRMP